MRLVQAGLRVVSSRMFGPLVVAVSTLTVASIGYVLIADYSVFDALYMSMITMGTVGFGEVAPLTVAGRSWTIGVIVAGFAVFVYSAASLTSLVVSGEVGMVVRKQRRAIVREQFRDHVIVVGFGRVGRAAVDAVCRESRLCVVVDTSEAVGDAAEACGAVFLHGDARDADVLRAAHVEAATALITTLDDPSNAVVALTARSLAADLRIVARVGDVAWSDRLKRAGASHVVPVYESVGAGLAATAVDAEVLAVLEVSGMDMRLEELEVGEGSAAVGLELRQLMVRASDVHLLGLRRDDKLARWHEVEGPISAGDVLVALGPPLALERLTALIRQAEEVEDAAR